MAGESSTSGGVTISVYSAYEGAQSGRLFVILEVQNDLPTTFDSYGASEASYVDPSGVQHEVIAAADPFEVRPGGTARVGLVFEDSPIGGTLFYEGAAEPDFNPIEFQIPIAV